MRFSTIPLTSGLPAVTLVTDSATIWFSSIAERDQRWPQLAGTPSSSEATAAVPLTVGDVTFGCSPSRQLAEDAPCDADGASAGGLCGPATPTS